MLHSSGKMARALLAMMAWLACAFSISGAAPVGFAGNPNSPWLTNLSQLRLSATENIRTASSFRIVAEVVEVDSASGVMVLRDNFSTEFVRMNLKGLVIQRGSTIRIEGVGCALKREGFGLSIVPGMVVDNDGIHPRVTESGKVFLPRGPIPIKLEWFNWYGDLGLNVEYEGPNISRRPVPGSVLLKAKVDGATTNTSAGLNFRYFEGNWEFLPDFSKLKPVRVGGVTNFDVGVRMRRDLVGLEFSGFISIPEDGDYTFHVSSDDGARLFVGDSSLQVQILNESPILDEPDILKHAPVRGGRWLTLEGTIMSAGVWGEGGEVVLRVENEEIRVEIFEEAGIVPDLVSHRKVQISGVYENLLNHEGERVPGRLLALNWKSIKPAPFDPNATANDGATTTARAKPALTTADEIKSLSFEQASQALPVLIRGVATYSKNSGAVIQDATRGVFVDVYRLRGSQLQRGEFCEIEGVTGAGGFSPVVIANRLTVLGAGQLPKPIRARWEQLVNGSLDNEFAEIDGVVTGVKGSQFQLLTEGGRIWVDLKEFRPESLLAYDNATVRIRGCFFVNFNFETRKLEMGSISIDGAVVELIELPPADPFNTLRRSIGELLFYDPKAAPFRRLKIGGQVIYSRDGECFLSDGTNSLRVTTRNKDRFAAGDLVDAVGFLQLGGSAPELREAVMRKFGSAPLPRPMKLATDQLFLARNAGNLVQVDATLVNQWRDASEHVMELQSGFLAFKARFHNGKHADPVASLGSRLEVTGVYVPQGKAAGDGTVNGFDLLLPSADGIRILATPPWWTLKRMLILAGILAAVLLGVLIWNKELHSKVEERGRQLETEIRNRQRAELQRAAEAERARIARDLHDELGTGLTEVSLLASAGLGPYHDGEKIRTRFHNIAEKARELVSSLDFIVWAIDSRRNSLQSFADYLGHYARELFVAAAIDCRLRIRMERGEISLTEAERHSLFLAVKETLNNIIRHASATEVEVQVSQIGDRLHIVIADNGKGFEAETIQRGDGLMNLRERLQAMRGECEFESHPGKGTTVKFVVPVTVDQNRPSSEIT